MSDVKESTYSFPETLEALLSGVQDSDDVRILGGCTSSETSGKSLGKRNLHTAAVPELHVFEKHERHFEIGAAVTLNELLYSEHIKIPGVLQNAIGSVATFALRNVATIGGNLCTKWHRMTLWAPLLALDAKLIFRKNTKDTKINPEPISKYEAAPIPDDLLLTRIRVPVDDWDYAFFTRVGPELSVTRESGSYTFLASLIRNKISSVRIAFAGPTVITNHTLKLDAEMDLIGQKVPLKSSIINEIVSNAEKHLDSLEDSVSQIVKSQCLNLIRTSLEKLKELPL